MKKVGYALIFLISLLLLLYINFPFERLIGSKLCQKGIDYRALEFKRFPPQLLIWELKPKGLPFEVELLKLKPEPIKGKFELEAKICQGYLIGHFNYLIREVLFSLKEIKLSKCKIEPLKIEGSLSGSGGLNFNKNDLTGGSGKFTVNGLKLVGIAFGIFKFDVLNLGKFIIKYNVKGKNLIKVAGEGKSPQASYLVKGQVNYNPSRPKNSYVNLNVTIKLKDGPLKGKAFKFKLRGSLVNLRVW